MERRNAEPGLIDGAIADLGGPRTGALLDRLDRIVPWEKLAEPVRGLYRNGKGGAPSWPAVTMLRCMMLAKWFGLSDPQLEEQLRDRLSFRRFAGLSLADKTPDETTFVVFRRRLREAGLDETLFQAVMEHIEKQGVLLKRGTLVDAMIVAAPRGRKRDDGSSTRDPEASFTSKHGRAHHGYKGHISVDQSGIVTGRRFSTAKHHDSRYIDELTEHETRMVAADSAYSSRSRRLALAQRGVIPAICYKRHRGQAALEDWQLEWNAMVSKLRARVEHPFARLRQMGYQAVRYRGLRRNEMDFTLNLVAHNFKRLAFLLG